MALPPDYRFCPQCGHALVSRCIKQGEPDRLCCDGCDFVFYIDPKTAAGIVATLDGKVLLLRRSIEPAYGKWVFPGGFVDRGEHPEQGAAREAMEEAGVEVRIDGLLGVYSAPAGSPTIVIVYRGEVVGGQPQALDESLEVRLFAPNEIPWTDLAFDTTHLAIADYLRALGVDAPPRRPRSAN